ncbi:FGGY-family carbohydrate kinase [uncultured Robinsoniella sp.]|uniref:FGGY-family carbohydrate kinase n=1 Tax=uncultured Robinsoniella sp. TaxID=904190 RepID=UPI00374FC483
MAKNYLMGIDIGTSQSKGVITTPEGKIISFEAVSHETVSKQTGYFEHDPERIWIHDFKYLVRQLLAKSSIEPENIRSVGISAIGPCVVVTNQKGQPLRDGILYGIDTRAEKQIREMEEMYGQEFLQKHCGNILTSQSAGPKILWIKENEPEIFRQTKMIMTSTSYLVYRLTGSNVMDYYTACAGYTPLFDYEHMCWDENIGKELGCWEMMPELLWSTDQAGVVTKSAADETGLAEGTIVNVGTCDAAAEAVSVGVISPGKTMLMLGSTAFMISVLNQPERDVRMWSAPYLFPGTFSLLGGMSAAGILTEWYINEIGGEHRCRAGQMGTDAYEELIHEAEMIPPGCDGLIALPYFCGERTPILDSDAKGVFFGLNLKHTRVHLYRALLESIAYGIRDNFQVFDEYGNQENEVVTVGGGCKNLLWLQIISDVTQKKQTVSEVTFGAAYGDAFLAGITAGMVQKEGIDRWNHEKYKVMPDQSIENLYNSNFRLYKELYEKTKMLMKRI